MRAFFLYSIMAGILSAFLPLLLLLQATPPAAPRLVELSYTYNKDAPTSPKLRPFNMTILKKGFNDLGIWQVYSFLYNCECGLQIKENLHRHHRYHQFHDLLKRYPCVIQIMGRGTTLVSSCLIHQTKYYFTERLDNLFLSTLCYH